MMKNKKVIITLLIAVFITTQVISFAATTPQPVQSGFEQYLTLQDTSNRALMKNKKSLSSDAYIQYLKDKGIKFEVTDTYYTSNGKIAETLIGKNMAPTKAAKAALKTRAREVKEYSSRQNVDKVSNTVQNLVSYSIGILVGKTHPVIAFIYETSNIFAIPKEDIGNTRTETFNYYIYTNVWHEVYSTYGYIPMVINESRRTNLDVYTAITNKRNNTTKSRTKTYNNIYIEYSLYYGKIVRNLQEAENRYNAGLRDPEIYRYNSGSVSNNTSILPR